MRFSAGRAARLDWTDILRNPSRTPTLRPRWDPNNCPPTSARARSCSRAAPAALADTELLALLLRTGLPGRDVFALSRRTCWTHVGGFAGLLHA